jgi:hypothetical protein
MSNTSGVFVAGYAEGSESELPVYDLDWGFTYEQFNNTQAFADADGVEEWHSVNPSGL